MHKRGTLVSLDNLQLSNLSMARSEPYTYTTTVSQRARLVEASRPASACLLVFGFRRSEATESANTHLAFLNKRPGHIS